MQVRLDFLPNLDGVFIVDRTLTGPAPGVRFQPTPSNIGALKQLHLPQYIGDSEAPHTDEVGARRALPADAVQQR